MGSDCWNRGETGHTKWLQFTMLRLEVCLLVVSPALALPQSSRFPSSSYSGTQISSSFQSGGFVRDRHGFIEDEDGCGVNPNTGEERQEGATWVAEDRCNQCRCRYGQAGCTKRQCTVQPRGEATLCGLDQNGKQRAVGAEWLDGCNQCHCTESGLPACQKKLCSPVEASSGCRDSSGGTRQEGEQWEQTPLSGGKLNTCDCVLGLAICELSVETKPAKPNQPNRLQTQPTLEASSGCRDSSGGTRQEGDQWVQTPLSGGKLNTCNCVQGLAICGIGPAKLPPNIRTVSTVSRPASGGSSASFGTSSNLGSVSSVTCRDDERKVKEVGDTWEEDCNTCICRRNGRKRCGAKTCATNPCPHLGPGDRNC